jgi:hypothetical protein
MKWISIIACIALASSNMSCSSIFTQGNRDVTINSNPEGARLVITDEKGVRAFEGTTPCVARLKTGKPYFGTKQYTLEFSKNGYKPATGQIESRVCGWYFGNFIFGGLLGLLIVDPLTGAVYTLPGEYSTELVSKSVARKTQSETTIQVVSYQDIPKDKIPHLVRLN